MVSSGTSQVTNCSTSSTTFLLPDVHLSASLFKETTSGHVAANAAPANTADVAERKNHSLSN
jgi:hypothetical protein